MSWLTKLFSGSARRADNPAPPAPGRTVVPATDPEPRRVTGESILTYANRMELEARRSGNSRLLERARRMRAIHS